MPIKLKRKVLQVKDPDTGEYIEVDSFSDSESYLRMSQLVQNADVADANKVPSAAVTNALKNDIDKINKWKEIALPSPTGTGNERTYSIDLSKYKEIYIINRIDDWDNYNDARIIPLVASTISYKFTYYTGTYYYLADVVISRTSIKIKRTDSNMASQNTPLIAKLFGKET